MGPFQITSCSTASAFAVVYLQQENNKYQTKSGIVLLVNPAVCCLGCIDGFRKLTPHATLFSYGNSYSGLLAFFQKQPNSKSEN